MSLCLPAFVRVKPYEFSECQFSFRLVFVCPHFCFSFHFQLFEWNFFSETKKMEQFCKTFVQQNHFFKPSPRVRSVPVLEPVNYTNCNPGLEIPNFSPFFLFQLSKTNIDSLSFCRLLEHEVSVAKQVPLLVQVLIQLSQWKMKNFFLKNTSIFNIFLILEY